MTDSSDGESVGSDCGRIGRGRRRACDDFFFFVVTICASATVAITRGIIFLEIFALLRRHATQIDSYLPASRDNFSAPYLRVLPTNNLRNNGRHNRYLTEYINPGDQINQNEMCKACSTGDKCWQIRTECQSENLR